MCLYCPLTDREYAPEADLEREEVMVLGIPLVRRRLVTLHAIFTNRDSEDDWEQSRS